MEDRYAIMRWRNEQIYHLRQRKPLTENDQDLYFQHKVSSLFDQDHPDQLLFSYLENETCIGYGGLVHINWIDKNAEISFIMDTVLEDKSFTFHWHVYLNLIENVAFDGLHLHKIFTYAFDLRPSLYDILDQAGYKLEARLKEHCFFENKYIDVIIHSKIKKKLSLRAAKKEDVQLTYSWANHPSTRRYAFNQDFISIERHSEWFKGKLTDCNCVYKILMWDNIPVGSIRLDINEGEALISYLISPDQTGKGFGKEMLASLITNIKTERPEVKILKGIVKKDNMASVNIFEKLQFERTELEEGLIEFKKSINHANRG